MLPKKVHNTIYLLGSILLVIGLPVSYFLLSVSIILLTSNWVLEGGFKEKLRIFKNRKSLLILLSVYLVHIIWFFNTKHFDWGFHDLRIKLPLLLLPLIFGTSRSFSRSEFKLILLVFIGAVLVNSFITSVAIFGFSSLDPVDSRDASLFISHIRFSLMVVFSIYTLFYLLLFKKYKIKPFERYIYTICLLWLIAFLLILQSFTGISIFLFLLPMALIWWSHLAKKPLHVLSSYFVCALFLFVIFTYIISSVNRFNQREDLDLSKLETYTLNGNKYDHYPDNEGYENGHRIWLYVAESELRTSWNSVSLYKFDSLDRKEQSIRYTLMRYMASLGLRKDSLGFTQLHPRDIEMIEKGYTNYIYKNRFSLYPRIYEMLWEIKRYNETGDPSGQSIAQRIEYVKVGVNIVKRFFWFGTGTGDLRAEFKTQYEIDQSLLKPEWQHRAHNQYLTFLIAFGVFGVLWILFALIAPIIIEKRYQSFIVVVLICISMLSMLNEDTLETHVGVSFFAFFYSLLLFASPQIESEGNEKTLAV